ncbi:MAG TPA: hypothetical protein VGI12_21035 [Vicinamibacterales bacterium]|jgi:hypothetical protein
MFTKAAILTVALAVPAIGFAQAPATTTAPKADKKAATKETTKAVASHTTSGVVKSSSDSSLVITKGTGKTAKDETFTVNASTKKTGDVKEGSKVTVAYTTEGSTMTATSIKAAAAHAAKKTTTTKK